MLCAIFNYSWLSGSYLLLGDFQLHKLFCLQLNLLPLSIGQLVLLLSPLKSLILLLEQLVVLLEGILVHHLKMILVLLVLVLHIIDCLMISLVQLPHFLVKSALHLLLHFTQKIEIYILRISLEPMPIILIVTHSS